MQKYKDLPSLKLYLDNLDNLCYPLLRWIIMSNRSHLSPLPKEKHIKEMPTEFQFVLVSDHPQKDYKFRKRRAEVAKRKGGRGSFYAFHGSAVGNWHCILRMGLKNYSNTDKMSAGAAYGPGIYLAGNASTSFSYMIPGACWNKSCFGQQIACIALTEVIDLRGDTNTPIKGSGEIYVVQDETIVTTRYLFIFANKNNHGYPNILASTLKLPEDIYKSDI